MRRRPKFSIATIAIFALLAAGRSPAQQTDTSSNVPDGHPARAAGNVEVLSDTEGVDFGPYLSRQVQKIRANWYNLIPVEARPPQLKSGQLTIEFAILPDGKVAGLRIVQASGSVAMDRAAWGGITASNPFDRLPEQFTGPYLALRMHYFYNPKKGEIPSQPAPGAVDSKDSSLVPH